MKRAMPEDAENYQWDAFNVYCDENSIAESYDDWIDWWNIWKASFLVALENLRIINLNKKENSNG